MRGQIPSGQVMFKVKAGWVGWGVGGCELLPRVYPKSPAGMGHCVPGAGLCTHRSTSDLGAAGGLSKRTVRMAGQGFDASSRLPIPVLAEGHG